MESVFWNTEDGRRNLTVEQTIYLEKELTKTWDAFAEYAGDFARWGGSKQIAHLGTAYRITPRHQVDFHFGFGLSQAAPGRFFAVGWRSFSGRSESEASAKLPQGSTLRQVRSACEAKRQ